MMFVAHVAPSDGPLRILLTTEFLTAPLFALLVGCGAQLAATRQGPRAIGRHVVRALMLVVLGLLLMLTSASVVIVLVHLGVLALICLPLARCRTGVLALWTTVAAATALVLPMVTESVGISTLDGVVDVRDLALGAVVLLGGDGPYRLAAFVLYATAGMLLMRWRAGQGKGRWVQTGGAGVVALAIMAGLLIAPKLLGQFEVHAYDGTPAETLGNLGGAAGILLLCWAVCDSPWGRQLPAVVREALAAPGRMALTLYCLQVLILHLHVVVSGGSRDDHWWMVALLIGVSLGFAALWKGVGAAPSVRPHLSPGMRRGPLEGLIDLVARRLVR